MVIPRSTDYSTSIYELSRNLVRRHRRQKVADWLP